MPSVIKNVPVKISRDYVLRLLKHDKRTGIVDEGMLSLINQMIDKGKTLAAAKAVYIDYWIKTVRERTVVLEGAGFDILSKKAAHLLWNAKKVTLFAATVGAGIEDCARDFTAQGAIANAAIMDAVGSAAVESVVDHVDHLTGNRSREEGFRTIKRFSPGYGDWELKEQKGLLKQLKTSENIGITLTEGYLMRPEKSVSGVIGWLKTE